MPTNNSSDYSPVNFNVQTGGVNGTLHNVAPGSVSGIPLISQGASTQPAFGTAVVAGGGTGDVSFTAFGVITGGTTSTGPLQSVVGLGTSGQVLTSNGAAALPTWQTSSSGAITLVGDSGSATGSTITLFTNRAGPGATAGSTVEFVNSGSTSKLTVTDGNGNTMMGNGTGNNTISGIFNTFFGTLGGGLLSSGNSNSGFGEDCGPSITTSSSNTLIGATSGLTLSTATGWNTCVGAGTMLDNNGSCNTILGTFAANRFTGGSNNVCIGAAPSPPTTTGGAGGNYTGTESSNICISSPGVVGENNTIHIGTQGTGASQQNACFIAGISGVTTSSSQFVTINTTTGQLGSTGTGFTGIITVNTQTFTSSGTYTPTTGMAYCMIEVVGGGGGGGGVSGATGQGAGAGGGASGSYSRGLFNAATIGSSKSVTIGAGGAHGAAGNNSGFQGGTTSVGSLITAGGGFGGNGTTGLSSSPTAQGGGNSVLGTGGDFQTYGMSGGQGMAFASGALSIGGTGGSSFFGGGAPPQLIINFATTGNPALSYGGGGGGACSANTTLSAAGGVGFAGIVYITEYIT